MNMREIKRMKVGKVTQTFDKENLEKQQIIKISQSKYTQNQLSQQASVQNPAIFLQKSVMPDDHPQQINVEIDNIIFNSQFDSGNLLRVEQYNQNMFNIWICHDCEGTILQKNYQSWFYFRVKKKHGEGKLENSKFTIKNMSNQSQLYLQGMTPVYRYGENDNFERMDQSCVSTELINENFVEPSFYHIFDYRKSDEWCYFAFTFPWSYQQNTNYMDLLEQKYMLNNNIYFRRELLTHSIEKRRVELITITSNKGLDSELQPRINFLFPDNKTRRPNIFKNKKYIILTARVHPGEIPASHVCNGWLQFLLDENNIQAQILRDEYVFCVIPLINPDGVYRGYWRTDTLGNNLNRCYINPIFQQQPAIFAIVNLILYYSQDNNLFMYIDCHAHSSQKGNMFFCNNLLFKEQTQSLIFTKLIQLNCEDFDPLKCSYSQQNMQTLDYGDKVTKEGSGRVAIYKKTKITHCYTLECNYNTGYQSNILNDIKYEKYIKLNQDQYPIQCEDFFQDFFYKEVVFPTKESNIYSPINYQKLAHGILISILDLQQINPQSRIQNSLYKNFDNLQLLIALKLLNENPYRFELAIRPFNRGLQSVHKQYIMPALIKLKNYLEGAENQKPYSPLMQRELSQNLLQDKFQNNQNFRIKTVSLQRNVNITNICIEPSIIQSIQFNAKNSKDLNLIRKAFYHRKNNYY